MNQLISTLQLQWAKSLIDMFRMVLYIINYQQIRSSNRIQANDVVVFSPLNTQLLHLKRPLYFNDFF